MAATEGAFSEHDFLSDLPVVLSAPRLTQPLSEIPAAMTIIDRQMIRDSGAWDVADLFRLVPGVYVAYNVDKGSRPRARRQLSRVCRPPSRTAAGWP